MISLQGSCTFVCEIHEEKKLPCIEGFIRNESWPQTVILIANIVQVSLSHISAPFFRGNKIHWMIIS